MPIEIPQQVSNIITTNPSYVPPIPDAPSGFVAVDTQDGGMFLADNGTIRDCVTSVVRQYQVLGDPTIRDMERPFCGADTLRIDVAGYRTAAWHDMTGTGEWRVRDVVDGVEGAWSPLMPYTSTTVALPMLSVLDPWGDGYLTATLDEARPVEQNIADLNTYYVIAPEGFQILSQSPAYALIGGYWQNGAGKNVSINGNPFSSRIHPITERVDFPITLLPGDSAVVSRSIDSGTSPVQSTITIVCLDRAPPRGMMLSDTYTGKRLRSRTMFHSALITDAKLTALEMDIAAPIESARNAWFDANIKRALIFYKRGSTPSRAMGQALHGGPYHRETAHIASCAMLALCSSLSLTERRKFALGTIQRTLHQIGQIGRLSDYYWWETAPLFTGLMLEIPEWRNIDRSGIALSGSYDTVGGDDDADDIGIGRFFTVDQMGDDTPLLGAAKIPALNDPVTSEVSQDGIVFAYGGPAVGDRYPLRIPGVVYDSEAGTVTVPARRLLAGWRAAREAITALNPRPVTSGGILYSTVAVVGGGNYREEWTDADNSMQKIVGYTWQHMPQACWNHLIHLHMGLEEYSTVSNLSLAAEDYMGAPQSYLNAYTNDGWRSGTTPPNSQRINGVYPAQNLESPFSATQWWNARDAAVAAGGVLAAKSRPGRPNRTQLSLVNNGDGERVRLSLTGYPEDGNSPITRWRYSVNEEPEVIVENVRLLTSLTSRGWTRDASNRIRYSFENAQGWGPWSFPKTFTPTGPTAEIVTSQRMTTASNATTYNVFWDGIDAGAIGHLLLVTAGRGTTVLTTPAGFTVLYKGAGAYPRQLNVFYKIVDAGDVSAAVGGRLTVGLVAASNFVNWAAQTARFRATNGGTITVGVQAISGAGGEAGDRGHPMPPLASLLGDDLLLYGATWGTTNDFSLNGETFSDLPSTQGAWANPNATDIRTGLLVKSNSGGTSAAAFFTDPSNGAAAVNTFGVPIRGVL